jgi:hypothetical protein
LLIAPHVDPEGGEVGADTGLGFAGDGLACVRPAERVERLRRCAELARLVLLEVTLRSDRYRVVTTYWKIEPEEDAVLFGAFGRRLSGRGSGFVTS